MKRICAQTLLLSIILLMIPEQALSRNNFSFGVLANYNAIEVLGETGIHLKPSTLYVGANGVYYEDKYSVYGIHTMVGNEISHGLTGKIGFKGVTGKFKHTRHDDPSLLALGFSISGQYNLSKVIASHYVPVILHATFTFGPKPLSFSDTEHFFETILGADWMFLENAAISASFRYLDVGFDQWDRTHGSGYGGFKFIF